MQIEILRIYYPPPNSVGRDMFVCGWTSGCVHMSVRPSCFALCAQYRLQFLPHHFKLHMKVVDDERKNPIDFGL